MTVSIRHLQYDTRKVVTFAHVKVHILTKVLDLLLEFRYRRGGLLLFFLAPLAKARTGSRVPSTLLVRNARSRLYIDRELDSAGRGL